MSLSRLLALAVLNAAVLWEAAMALGLTYIALGETWPVRLRRTALLIAAGWAALLVFTWSCEPFLGRWIDFWFLVENGYLSSDRPFLDSRFVRLFRETWPIAIPAFGSAAALALFARRTWLRRPQSRRALRWSAGAALALPASLHALLTVAGAARTPVPAWETPRLVKALNSYEEAVRIRALESLSRTRSKAAEAVPELEGLLLSEKEGGLRHLAARALSDAGPAGIPALVRGLRHESQGIRRAACSALAEMGKDAETVLPDLIRAADDPDAGVRWNAFRALTAFGPTAAPASASIAKSFERPGSEEWHQAGRALSAIGPASIPVLLPVLRRDSTPTAGGRYAAANVLRGFGAAAAPALPDLLRLVRSSQPDDRHVAMLVLDTLGPAARPALPSLLLIEKDPKASPSLKALASRLSERLGKE